MSRVVLVELGYDGWAGLPDRLRFLLADADVLVGDAVHLIDVPGSFAQAREPWPAPLRAGLIDLLDRHAGRSVVAVLGQPWHSDLGRERAESLVELLGPELRVEPGVPAAVLAGARLGWSSDEVDIVDLHGRDRHVLLRELADGRRLLVLPGGDPHMAAAVAVLLRARGYGESRMVAWAALGSTGERSLDATASTWPAGGGPTDVLALELKGPLTSPWLAGLPDAAYEPVGLVTPRDLRAAALARLAPQPGQLLWDLGSGGGCVAVEWLRAHRHCRAVIVEPDLGRATATEGNARRLGVTAEVLVGSVPQVLAGRAAPDAVFVGGVHARGPVLDACLAVLRPGARVVVQGAAETLGERYAALGGELTRLTVDVATRTGSQTRWTTRPPVTQWAWQS